MWVINFDAMRVASLTVLTGAQALFNRLLRFDPDTQQRLGALAGKVICLELRDASLRLYVLPTATGVELSGEHDGAVDVTIAGSVAVFARLMSARGQAPVAGELQISGDIELGQKFQRIVRGLDIDAEEMAAQWVGDVPARQLGNVFRAARAWARHAGTTLERDAVEYLQEEARVLAKCEQVAAFLSGVDRLRADVDRLEQRVKRLLGDR